MIYDDLYSARSGISNLYWRLLLLLNTVADGDKLRDTVRKVKFQRLSCDYTGQIFCHSSSPRREHGVISQKDLR
jgi:hypothetical protein